MGPVTVRAGLTRQLAEFATSTDLEFASSVLDPARVSLVDTVGVAFAAAGEGAVAALRRSLGARLPAGLCGVLTTGERTDAATAALLNGTAAHALDYDDVNDLTLGHPSAVLWPAVLSVGREIGATGRQMLEAYAVGLNCQLIVAANIDVETHYDRGWHSTATIGVLGAVAAVARLRGLDELRVRHALGIAASLAGGSRQNFGTMTKPLHAGIAARNAVFAAGLAQHDFTADPDQLDGPLGFLHMFDGRRADRDDAPVDRWLVEQYGLNVKRFPSCYCTHGIAECALSLQAEHALTPQDVKAVRITVQPGALAPLIHHRPTDATQARFSAEYVCAAALADGELALGSFTDEQVARPHVKQLIELIDVKESSRPPNGPERWTYAYAIVSVETKSGTVWSRRVDDCAGHFTKPLSEADMRRKFDECVAASGLTRVPGTAFDQLWHFDTLEQLGDVAFV